MRPNLGGYALKAIAAAWFFFIAIPYLVLVWATDPPPPKPHNR